MNSRPLYSDVFNISPSHLGHQTVFVKELAKYMENYMDDLTYFPRDYIHTFLIRHPIRKLKSYLAVHRRIPEDLPGTQQCGFEQKSFHFNRMLFVLNIDVSQT